MHAACSDAGVGHQLARSRDEGLYEAQQLPARRRSRPCRLQLLCRYARAASLRAASNLLMKRVTVSEKECSFVLGE
eukprot:scaffold142738_cov136-Phaeocystis_antarctica.AAC.1